VQKDGRIVAGGALFLDVDNSDFALARYGKNGRLDRHFGTGGRVLTNLGGRDGIRALGLQPDGRLVTAGVTGPSLQPTLALARYLAR
jgi:hypothetical protein